MFGKNDNNHVKDIAPVSAKSLDSTFLGAEALFKGELSFKGSLCIDGDFEGQRKTPGTLIVNETGMINADIEAGTVICKGRVTGNIVATQKVEMYSNSQVIGDVTTPSMNMQVGAVLDGKCDMHSKTIL